MDQKPYEDFIHWGEGSYHSFEDLKYLGICLYLFLSVIVLVYGIVGKIVFSIVTILILDMLYIIFLCVLHHHNIKKVYSLRFLVNGISSVFLSMYFMLLGFTAILAINYNTLILILIAIFSYVLFVISYCIIMLIFIKKGIFNKEKNKKVSRASIICCSLTPVAGMIGYSLAARLNSVFEISNEMAGLIAFWGCEFVVCLSSLGLMNFMKYYYCRKYSITCTEDGDTTSPHLEPPKKVKKARTWKPNRFVKILIIIASIIGFFLACILIAGIILAIIKVING